MSSELKVNKISPESGTAFTLGDSGDTFTVPTGASFVATDELKTNKISPSSGTSFTFGDSGDTFTIPSGATITNSGTATGFGGGKINQVVQTTKTDTFSTTSASYTDITGLSVSITPTSTSSKILIKTCISWGGSQNVYGFGKFVRGSTDILMGAGASGNRTSATFPMQHLNDATAVYNCFVASSEFLDSPSTTSATTYKIQVRTHNGTHTFYVNRPDNDNDESYIGRFTSSITAMEVLA